MTKLLELCTSEAFPEVIIAVVVIIGGTVAALKKLGWIHFGKAKCKIEECPDHKVMEKTLREVRDNQIKNMEKHEQHDKGFANGKEEFKTIKSEVENLKIGVAVLLDRSGGIPKDFNCGRI